MTTLLSVSRNSCPAPTEKKKKKRKKRHQEGTDSDGANLVRDNIKDTLDTAVSILLYTSRAYVPSGATVVSPTMGKYLYYYI